MGIHQQKSITITEKQETVRLPTDASWVVRKILGTRDMLLKRQAGKGNLMVTMTLWGRLCNWLGIQRVVQDWRSEITWISDIAKKNAGGAEIKTSVFVMIVYIIWRERNKIRFQRGSLCLDNVLREIVMHIHLRGQHKAKWKPILQALNKQLRLEELLYRDTNGSWFNAQHPDDSFRTTPHVTKALAPRFETSRFLVPLATQARWNRTKTSNMKDSNIIQQNLPERGKIASNPAHTPNPIYHW
ncbi:hypothetical protein H5410_018712 [Solanum commersonii]|uniref:Uncharacterized protein n=1 Tax=Solanum commersonii TaxID=4109 RepID=A0A9J6A391_SOLCO|nr:hypothetical protein H5410_018712 [Solanum commersonii]